MSLLDQLRNMLNTPQPKSKAPSIEPNLASAILMIEVARADYADAQEERAALASALGKQFSVPSSEIDSLIQQAESQADTQVSLHKVVETINQQYSASEKSGLMESLWQIAFADGELHHYEEHFIRRIADLIHVPHKEFIRSKLQVQDAG